MQAVSKGPNIDKSALLIVDMQNDFLHRDGASVIWLGKIPKPRSTCRF
jgi:isochorismate hydrolase